MTRPSGPVPVPHARVDVTGGLWALRQRINREQTLPAVYEQCRRTGRLAAWRLRWRPGRPHPPHLFWDSDVAKWLEAAAYSLATRPDPALRRRVDRLARSIERAQQPDGYLNTHFILVEPEKRWTNLRDQHELYCAGHLMEAAVAHAETTGDRRLLDALVRCADLIGRTFGRGGGRKRGYPGHEEIELALVKLYQATGQRRHLELARYFVDERGRAPHYFDIEAAARGEKPSAYWAGTHRYSQSHRPVREQREVTGHAVRAMYLYSAMADLAAETGDAGLREACRRLWRHLVERRIYLTGGLGSTHANEGFTEDYDLPNETAYAETCAAIGLVFWARRMIRLEPGGAYADVMERALYNNVLASVSLDGRHFAYRNPLAAGPAAGGAAAPVVRPAWHGCACCPPNIARLLASLGGYLYGRSAGAGWVHLYASSRVRFDGPAGTGVTVVQETGYPWTELVRIAVRPDRPVDWTLALRIPGWCRTPRLRVNGRPVAVAPILRRGYARLRRRWRAGDRVELTLPMPVERVRAHPAVRADAGRVALQRGPVVYCLEEADNGPGLDRIRLPDRAAVRARWAPRLLGGVVVLSAAATETAPDGWRGRLYRHDAPPARPRTIRAVPYAVWGNRRPGEMLVWLRE